MQDFQVIFERLNRKKDDVIPAEEFIDGLRVFDKDGNGLIPATELRHLLTTLGMKVQVEFELIDFYYLGERLTDDEVEQLISEFEDKKGMIMYEEFVKTVLQR